MTTEAQAKILALLPATASELMAKTGYSRKTVYQCLAQFRAEKKVYVSGYAEDSRGRLILEVLSRGSKQDKPRPGQRWTPAERMRRTREKKRVEL